MWYVIQVRTGTEETIRKQCERLVDHYALERCFIPYFEEMKRYKGKWHKENKILFPGYVFAVSEIAEALFIELKKVVGLTKILGMENTMIALTEEETKLLLNFGKEEQIVTVSQGIIIDDCVKVLSGPLVGREGLITRIDRHRRKACLALPMFGRIQNIEIGLEILEKR